MNKETLSIKVEVDYVDVLSKELSGCLDKEFDNRLVTREDISQAESRLREALQSGPGIIGKSRLSLRMDPMQGHSAYRAIFADVSLTSGSKLTVEVATWVRIESKEAALERVLAPYFGKPNSSLQSGLHDLHAQVRSATGEGIYVSSTGKKLKVVIKDEDNFLACSVPLICCHPILDKDVTAWVAS